MASAQSRAWVTGMSGCCITAPFGWSYKVIKTRCLKFKGGAVGLKNHHSGQVCYYTNRRGLYATFIHEICNFFTMGRVSSKAEFVILAAGQYQLGGEDGQTARARLEGAGYWQGIQLKRASHAGLLGNMTKICQQTVTDINH